MEIPVVLICNHEQNKYRDINICYFQLQREKPEHLLNCCVQTVILLPSWTSEVKHIMITECSTVPILFKCGLVLQLHCLSIIWTVKTSVTAYLDI